MKSREEYDKAQIARAEYFTACQFLGRGKFDTRKASSLVEAEAIGQSMGGAMIYAVTPEGWSVHVKNVSAAPKA